MLLKTIEKDGNVYKYHSSHIGWGKTLTIRVFDANKNGWIMNSELAKLGLPSREEVLAETGVKEND